MQNFKSKFKIGEEIVYRPYTPLVSDSAIATGSHEVPEYRGTITCVKFTKAKVFYDILSDYSGRIDHEVDSINVLPKGKSFNKKK